MKNQQRLLCEKHHELLEFIWTWGRGCALQPLLVEISLWFGWFASAQMCRRGIRELKDTSLIKVKTWTDGRSEILILTKPALAFVSQKEPSQISSFPKHTTRDTELLSVCRMMYVLQRAKVKEQYSYALFMNEIGINTIHLHMGQLRQYWEAQSWAKGSQFYNRELAALQKSATQRKNLHNPDQHGTKTVTTTLTALPTLESLHKRGIFIGGHTIIDVSNEHCLLFGIFNIHNLSANKVLTYYVLCRDWIRLFDGKPSIEAKLVIYPLL